MLTNKGKPRCALAVLWYLRAVLARLFVVSFFLFYLVLHRFSEDDDPREGLEEEVGNESRGQASASTRERRHPC